MSERGRNIINGERKGAKLNGHQTSRNDSLGSAKKQASNYENKIQTNSNITKPLNCSNWLEHPKNIGSEVKFVRRPDLGRKGKPINLITNHFTLRIGDIPIYHYDVKIKQIRKENAEKKKGSELKLLNKSINRSVIESVWYNKSNQLDDTPFFYDGRANVYTMREINDAVFRNVHIKNDRQEYELKLTSVNKIINLNVLNHFDKKSVDEHATAKCILEIMFRHLQSKMSTIGRSLCDLSEKRNQLGCLGDGKTLWAGHYMGARVSAIGPNIVVDTSAAVVLDFDGTMIEYMKNCLRMDPNRFGEKDFIKLKSTIMGMKISCNHFGYERQFKITNLSSKVASQEMFEWSENGVSKGLISVFEYFKKKYPKIVLRYPKLPCIISNGKMFPLEICSMVKFQEIKKSNLNPKQEGDVIKLAALNPDRKWANIIPYVENLKISVKQHFDVDISANPIALRGRVLPSPQLNYKGKFIPPRDGKWDLRDTQLYKPAKINSWAVINLSEKFNDSDKLVNNLINVGRKMGIMIGNPIAIIDGFGYPGRLAKKWMQELKGDFLFFIVPDINNKAVYRDIKTAGDVDMKVKTQCCKEITAIRAASEKGLQICANLMLKINIRLRGVNAILANLDLEKDISNMMMLGADVTHPGEGDEIFCSIASVVGSYDKELCEYGAQIRAQKKQKIGGSTEEMIEEIDMMVNRLIVNYCKKNKRYPGSIIFYRDGVSEGQYSQVKTKEIDRILNSLKKCPAKIKLTFIIVGKRLRTKFKPMPSADTVGKTCMNVPPGTTVDTVIVDRNDHDFYQVSHEGIQGTSVPTHYYVLYDDNNFKADDLQLLTFYLCHTYVRCTRTIADPAPARYAHDAAYRSRELVIHKFGSEVRMNRKSNEDDIEFENRKMTKIREINEKIQVAPDNLMYFI